MTSSIDSRPIWTTPAARIGLCVVTVGLVFAYYATSWRTIDEFVRSVDHCEILFNDFVVYYYRTARAVLAGTSPTKGYFYTPFFALLVMPFGLLTPSAAYMMWAALQAVAAIGLWIVPAVDFWRRSFALFYVYLLLSVSSFPLLHNAAWGQVSVPLTLMVIGALFFYKRGWKATAAVLLAAATAIKYYPVLFIVYFMMRRELRFLVVFFVAVVAFFLVVPAAALGVQETLGFYQVVGKGVGQAAEWVPRDFNSQFVVNVLDRDLSLVARRLGTELPSESWRPVFATMGGVILLINGFLVWRTTPRGDGEACDFAFMLIFASLPFVVTTSWPHYFVHLPFCQVVLLRSLIGQTGLRRRLVALLPLVTSMLLSSSVVFNMFGRWQLYSYVGCLFFANFLLLIATYSLVLMSMRPSSRNTDPDHP
ncbi:MAG: DUF2029 domain-containing protein [Acidobacteriota bacterium]|nr:MAG: DUF2029 domain-containing protein [Acidobacteriota bacterium]